MDEDVCAIASCQSGQCVTSATLICGANEHCDPVSGCQCDAGYVDCPAGGSLNCVECCLADGVKPAKEDCLPVLGSNSIACVKCSAIGECEPANEFDACDASGVTNGTCSVGQCVECRGNGIACEDHDDCCGDIECHQGVCCSSKCGLLCQSCNLEGAVGTCTFVPHGEDPLDQCSGDNTCSGDGHCCLPNSTSEAGVICSEEPSACCSGICVQDSDAPRASWCTCVPSGVRCTDDDQCCSGFCAATVTETGDPRSVCVPKQDDGGPCGVDAHCINGMCIEDFRGAGWCTCVPEDVPCESDDECCSGLCGMVVGESGSPRPACVPKREDGDPCIIDSHCISDVCIEDPEGAGWCTCVPRDERCESDDECCTQLCVAVLDDSGTRLKDPVCLPKREDGDPCVVDAHCINGECIDGSDGGRWCTCVPEDVRCETGQKCCSGLCAVVGNGSGIPRAVCVPKRANGDPCVDNNECISGVCSSGFCGLPKGAICASHSECSTLRCVDLTCKSKVPDGADCGEGNDCVSSFCVDGVCCNAACASTCTACDLSGSVGTCTNLPDGEDPANECIGESGVCNGVGACRCTTASQSYVGTVGCRNNNFGFCNSDSDCASADCLSTVFSGICIACSGGAGCADVFAGIATDWDCAGGICVRVT